MLRTINKTIELLKQIDPETAITPYFLRMLIKKNKVRFVTSGSKYIVDVLSVKDYLGVA